MDTLLSGLRAAAEPTRLRLLALAAEGELTVSELTRILGQSQPRVSRHLKLLCDAGLLERHREGTWVFYRLAERGEQGPLARRLVEMMPDADAKLGLDRARLQAIKQARAHRATDYFRANADRWAEIRSLYVPEGEVECALLALAGDRAIGDFLDIGTGTGRMLEIFAGRVGRGLGVDLSHDMLRVARSRLEQLGVRNCQVRHGDMYNLTLPGASFDFVVLHQVLHYADEPRAVLAEAARLLRPGGSFAVVDFARHELEYLRTEHRHRWLGFDAAEVVRWLAAAGLRPAPTQQLVGDPLTVLICSAERPPRQHAGQRAEAQGVLQ